MNSVEFREEDDDNEVKFVKAESSSKEGRLGCSHATSGQKLHPECTLNGQSNKRKQVLHMSDGSSNETEIITTLKKRRLIPESLLSCMRNRDSEPSIQSNVELLSTSSEYNSTSPGEEEETVNEFATSYKKPLYGISHKITEKRNPVTSDLLTTYELYDKANQGSPSNMRMFNDLRKRESVGSSVASSVSDDSNIYSLIQKMFFTLNTLNSNMSQLHSKVDLLSLEVSRIKKKVSPHNMVAEFHPPLEYQLTSTELQQVMDQSTSAGDLACRLLVQLFPELFGSNAFSRNCTTCGFLNKNKLESLHLQLIRNYVEACHPSVKNNTVWQVDVLPQINDFFNRFWAERQMESSHRAIQAPNFFESQPCQNSHFGETKEQEENVTLERANPIVSEYALNAQDLTEFLDEASSPGEFSVFLLHRLFPEIFNQRQLGDRCFGELENFVLDPHRLQLIRQYTEIYFPDIQEEEVWLQQCVQRINDELESVFMDGSECDDMRDDCYESNAPDDLSIVKVEDGTDIDRPGRRSKKIWLVPFDFDRIDIPAPDFEVPYPQFLLSKEQIKNIYETSLSIGNFASRLLVHLFPELFTHENLRKQYNCSGSLGKKQLDPVRIKLIRHYVQILYPRAKNDRVWTLEFVGKLDERCRRRDTEQRRSYQQQRKVYLPMPERRDFAPFELNSERYRDLIEGPPLPPERSTKDFCKIPLDKIVVPPIEFPVPSLYLLSDKEIRDIVQQSLSVGNFAARLLVRLFPELFTPENLRLQYNHSGACNKKQLDPVRLRLIRHYVEAVYPVDKMEEVWHYECIPSIDERCRRPNRKKCDILKKATKNQINTC